MQFPSPRLYSSLFTGNVLLLSYFKQFPNRQQAIATFRNNSKYKASNLPDLGRYKIPFLIVIGIMWLLEIIINISRAAWIGAVGSIYLFGAILWGSTSLFCSILFIITGCKSIVVVCIDWAILIDRVVSIMNKTTSINPNKSKAKSLKMVRNFPNKKW